MIPGPFDYHRPSTLGEAAGLLSSLGDDARVLAGGHSLIPMMKLRFAQPAQLVDLSGVDELKGAAADGGDIVVRAMTTQHDVIASELLAKTVPILRETALLIADPQVRYMGTIGGNAANGDPGNDMPAVMIALDATYVLSSVGGERRVAAREYYHGAYDTAARHDEILSSIRIPTPRTGHGWAYEKLKRKVGDYATAASAVIVNVEGGRIAHCAIALTNVADTPLYAEEASKLLVGAASGDPPIAQVARAAEAIASPTADGRGSAEYRAKMAGIMTARALKRALARAAQ